jgi:3-hydroxyisobutyrate dehydrogenase-like beta-hydroxyacid dehydrogenase
MDRKIGFIGLGQMGKWMALNLVKAGFEVWVQDIDPQAVTFVKERGAKSAETPLEIAAQTEWIFLSLPNTEVVESVILGKDGIINGGKPGLIVVDLSTIGYMATLEIGEKLNAKGILFADAPVSGMEARAQEATLTMMFGGDESILEKLRPALNVMGNKIVHMGKVGSGQLTKLINQLLFNISCAGVAEVLPMAAKLGLDPEKVTQVVTTGTGRSFAAEFFVPLALENRFDEGYPIKHAYKDLVSAAEISAHQKIPLPVVQATTATFQMGLAEGFGDESKGSLIKVFERMLGVEFRKKGDAS